MTIAGCNSSLSYYDKAVPPPDGIVTTDGSSPVGDDDDTTPILDSASTTIPETATVESVDPWYGTVGAQVTVHGGPFVDPVEVTFDGVSASVDSVTTDAVVVTVPDLGDDVIATLEVATAAGPATGPATGSGGQGLTFQYYLDGTDQIGAFGTIEWNEIRGSYWASGTVSSGDAEVMFPVPTETSWPELLYAPQIDSCEENYVPANTAYIYDPGLPSIDVSAGSTVHTLPSDADRPFIFFQSGLPVSTGSAYDLEATTGNPEWPGISISHLSGRIPDRVVLTDPDISGATPPYVDPNVALSWNGPYDGDGILVLMDRQRYDENAGAWIDQADTITCWLADDGSFTVPSLWTDWQTNDGVLLYFGRYREPENTIVPYNNSRSAVVGAYWLVGFLYAN